VFSLLCNLYTWRFDAHVILLIASSVRVFLSCCESQRLRRRVGSCLLKTLICINLKLSLLFSLSKRPQPRRVKLSFCLQNKQLCHWIVFSLVFSSNLIHYLLHCEPLESRAQQIELLKNSKEESKTGVFMYGGIGISLTHVYQRADRPERRNQFQLRIYDVTSRSNNSVAAQDAALIWKRLTSILMT
jgi:hypothetical protein